MAAALWPPASSWPVASGSGGSADRPDRHLPGPIGSGATVEPGTPSGDDPRGPQRAGSRPHHDRAVALGLAFEYPPLLGVANIESGPRSSGDRALASGARSAGSNPAGGTKPTHLPSHLRRFFDTEPLIEPGVERGQGAAPPRAPPPIHLVRPSAGWLPFRTLTALSLDPGFKEKRRAPDRGLLLFRRHRHQGPGAEEQVGVEAVPCGSFPARS